MSSLIKTKSKTVLWLIRKTNDEIKTTKLQSNGDILRRLFFLKQCKKNVKKFVTLYI